mmetsp:Transcript_4646/g.12923  ORF Transcript_4646/g.12923 Transcript_4646/m.12923 type:complete len:291 (+) Transcript_4646:362-1234(+)|eukprot:CAMPEP_0117663140 /NCGR_PEP_ID=MMETSP0804-20121206/8433_1 /TAXON_ID=1074897 /ORGANISM="Tetraselmis astigmatica, Strain CCMP880" /LENGTH=290 /DNA_ID=CAMNT_0005470097 /DNA_START=1046 /DNA_END=1918 /DNA_ORIENTATION=+
MVASKAAISHSKHPADVQRPVLRMDSMSSESLTGSVFSVDHGAHSPGVACSDTHSVEMASSEESMEYSQGLCDSFSGHSVPDLRHSLQQAPLDISLRIHNAQGKVQILKFAFDLQHDSFDSVAREMVSDLELPDSEAPRIAAKIQSCVKKEHSKQLLSQQQQRQTGLVANPRRATDPSAFPSFYGLNNSLLRRSVSTSGVLDHDPVSSQHHALAAKHNQRMACLLASCLRRTSRESGDGSSDTVLLRRCSMELESQRRTKVNYCVIRGMYVPDVVKKVKARSCSVVETKG